MLSLSQSPALDTGREFFGLRTSGCQFQGLLATSRHAWRPYEKPASGCARSWRALRRSAELQGYPPPMRSTRRLADRPVCMVFVVGRALTTQTGAVHDPIRDWFQRWESGNLTLGFTSPEELQGAVTREVHPHVLSDVSQPIADDGLLDLAQSPIQGEVFALARVRSWCSASRRLHRQEILRP